MFHKRRIGTGLLLCLVATASFARTEIWFGPHSTSVDYYTAFEPSRTSEWQALAYSIDVYKFYLSKITTDFAFAEQPHANYFTSAQLQQAAAMLSQFGIKAAFEIGGPEGDCTTGDPTAVGYAAAVAQANRLQPFVDRYRIATGRTDDGIHALAIDGPIVATHVDGRHAACTFNNEQSLQAYTSYVAELRSRFPQAKIGVIANFPNLTYDGRIVKNASNQGGAMRSIYLGYWDYRDILNQLVSRAATVGVALDFLQIDHPADLIVNINGTNRGNWGQLRDVAMQARGLGLRVNIIFNTDNGLHWSDANPFPFQTQTNNKYSPPAPITQSVRTANKLYATNSLAFAARWKDEQMPVDIATFQSWHNYPYSVLQDSAPQLDGAPSYHKFAAANIAEAVNTIFNRRICTPTEYKFQRADLNAYFSQWSGVTLENNVNTHWNSDGAFELINVSGDAFGLHPRLDAFGNPVSATRVSLCRPTPPNTCTEAEYYRRRPDVGAVKLVAMQHWQNHGRHEGMCQPSRLQETCSFASYFNQRPDVHAAGGGNTGFASMHWTNWGRFEGMCKPMQ